MDDHAHRRSARRKRVLLVAACFAVLLPLLEVALRMAVPRQVDVPHIRVYPEGFYTWEPNTEFVYQNLDRVEPPAAAVRINGHGLRGAALTADKPADRMRVLVLGDSFTAAIQLPEARIFTTLLEQALRRDRLDVPREIVNAGFNGVGTAQELLYFIHRGVHLEPAVVVLQFTYNDLDDNVRHGGYHLKGGELHLAATFASPPFWKGPLFAARDYLGNRSLAFYLTYRAARALVTHSARAEAVISGEERQRIELLHRLAARLVAHANAAGAPVIILLIPLPIHLPMHERIEPPVYAHVKAGFAAITADSVNQMVVMDEAFARAVRASGSVFLPYDGHLGEDGHRLVAEGLAAAIRRIPRSRPQNAP